MREMSLHTQASVMPLHKCANYEPYRAGRARGAPLGAKTDGAIIIAALYN